MWVSKYLQGPLGCRTQPPSEAGDPQGQLWVDLLPLTWRDSSQDSCGHSVPLSPLALPVPHASIPVSYHAVPLSRCEHVAAIAPAWPAGGRAGARRELGCGPAPLHPSGFSFQGPVGDSLRSRLCCPPPSGPTACARPLARLSSAPLLLPARPCAQLLLPLTISICSRPTASSSRLLNEALKGVLSVWAVPPPASVSHGVTCRARERHPGVLAPHPALLWGTLDSDPVCGWP